VGALGHTGRLVTSAALILAVSFMSLSTNPDLPVRVIATGLSLGILLDAFVVRTLLVPALVAVMGRWNWWMPTSVARLLRVTQKPEPVEVAG
jgi:RND superfamily putative drug exporter